MPARDASRSTRNWFSFANRRRPRKPASITPRRLHGMESLEQREVMAANITAGLITYAGTNPRLAPNYVVAMPDAFRVSAVVSGRTLLVEGTPWRDVVDIQQSGDALAIAGVRIINRGQAFSTISASLIDKIEVRTYGGDDEVNMGSVRLRTEVWGDSGIDRLTGGSNIDILHGGPDGDFLWGNDAADRLFGDAGVDQVWGGRGMDELFGGSERDELWGGADGDTLWGELGDDDLHGEDGKDFLFGGEGFDTVWGGGQSDWLEAGAWYEPTDGEGGLDWNAHVWAINGATIDDVDQNQSGTCAFLSSLASASRWNDLSQNISYEGNFTYAVWLYDDNVGGWFQERVRFDGSMRTAVGNNFDPNSVVEGEFWTIVYQRAYLQHFHGLGETNWILTAWFGGEPTAQPMTAITGNQPLSIAIAEWPPEWVQSWVAAGPATAYDGEHAYSLLDVFQDAAGAWQVLLFNPWASDSTHEDSLTPLPEPLTFTGSNDGFITVSWDVFAANLLVADVSV